MATDALPRIADATEKTAFASEENYFILNSINDSIKSMDFSLNLKLGSISMMLGEFFEMNIREMERRALLSNNSGGAAPTSTTPSGAGDDTSDEEGIGWGGLITAGLAAMAVSDLNINKYIEGSGLLTTIFGGITKSIKGLGLTQRILDLTKPLQTFFSRVGRMFGIVGKITGTGGFKLLDKVGKIIPFVRIFSGIVSFVQGFLDGYDEEGLFGGFKEGFAKLAENFLGWPINFLKDGLAWVLEKFGVLSPEQKEQFNQFDFIKIIGDGVRMAFDWFKLLFTDPVQALKNLWQGYVNMWTSIGTWVYDNAVKPVADWFSSMFAWAGDKISGAWTSLTDFIQQKWQLVKTWFTEKLLFVSTAVVGAWTGLTEFVSGKWAEVKQWFSDKLTWASEGIAEGWTSLKDFVSGKWEDIKTWFTDKLTFAGEAIESGANFISNLVTDAWQSVKDWFTESLSNLKDKLPSIEDIKTSLISNLPSWMIPDSYKTPQMIAQEAKEAITQEQARIDRSMAGENEYYGREESGRADSAQKIAELEAELRDTLMKRGMNENQVNQIINQTVYNNNSSSSADVVQVGNDTNTADPRPDR